MWGGGKWEKIEERESSDGIQEVENVDTPGYNILKEKLLGSRTYLLCGRVVTLYIILYTLQETAQRSRKACT